MKTKNFIQRLIARIIGWNKYIDLAQINSFKRAGFQPLFFLNKFDGGKNNE